MIRFGLISDFEYYRVDKTLRYVMKISFGEVDGDGWEKLVHKALRLRYPQNYTEVPARFGGDLGIESFCQGGVYQCYCPDGNPSQQELYEGQRDKMTQDINKLIKNESEIKGIIGSRLIDTWYFVTPNYKNKELLSHCRKKEREVVRENLSHIDDDNFKIQILIEDDFLIEFRSLFSNKLLQINAIVPTVNDHDIEEWKNNQLAFYENLEKKIPKLTNDSQQVKELIRNNIKSLIQGEAILHDVGSKFPELYEKVTNLVNAWEDDVYVNSMINSGSAEKHFKETADNFYKELLKECDEQISLSVAKHIQRRTISFWLCNCPLDFS